MRSIMIASDHAGFRLKQVLVEQLRAVGHAVEDLGPADESSVDYPEYAAVVARRVAAHPGARGVLICGTGIGMSIAANKVPGVRAAVVESEGCARLARQHNDANVVCVGSRVLAAERAVEIVRLFLDTAFEGGRHQGRIDKIAALERA